MVARVRVVHDMQAAVARGVHNTNTGDHKGRPYQSNPTRPARPNGVSTG